MRTDSVVACCGAVVLAAYLGLFCWFRTTHTAWFHGHAATVISSVETRQIVWRPFIPLMSIDARVTGRGAAVVSPDGILWYVNGNGEALGP